MGEFTRLTDFSMLICNLSLAHDKLVSCILISNAKWYIHNIGSYTCYADLYGLNVQIKMMVNFGTELT